MGASDFTTKAHGATVKEAFDSAVREAQYDHGHAGCTGTIAEKDESDMPWTVVRRTFEAGKYPKGSEERARLNRDALTSEYMPSQRYALCDRGTYFRAYRTKREASAEAYAANVECGALDASEG